MRTSGRAAALLAGLGLVFLLAVPEAGAKSLGHSGARSGGAETYMENHSFGTNREGGQAFWIDPETGDRRFRTPEMLQNEEPEEIEILPVHPEVHPAVRPSGAPVVIKPEGSGN